MNSFASRMLRIFYPLVLLLVLSPLASKAAIDTYEFTNEENRDRFHNLTEILRCPKCQNQNIADSDSPIASDLRREIHRMVEEGQNDQNIVDFMVARYGDFVLYNPKLGGSTYVLWYAPIGLILIGAVVVVLIARRKKTRAAAGAVQEDEAKRQQRLKELLDDDPA